MMVQERESSKKRIGNAMQSLDKRIEVHLKFGWESVWEISHNKKSKKYRKSLEKVHKKKR